MIFNVLIVTILLLANVWFLPTLPAQIPMHWNMNGQIDQYMVKNIAVWIIPVLCIMLLIIFKVLPSFDPKKKNYPLFKREWSIMQSGIVLFLAYVHGLTLYCSLNPSTSIMRPMFLGLGLLFVLIGACLPNIRQNYFIGIRLPWTLSNPENWSKTHRFAGRCFLLIGVVFIAEAYLQWQSSIVMLTTLVLGVLAPSIYSYLLFRNK